MNPEKLETLYDDLTSKARKIFKAKNSDYSTGHDALDGFKVPAFDMDIDPIKAWYVFASKHWSAIRRYCVHGYIESEPIEGRLVDIINYAALLYGIIKEREEDMGGTVFHKIHSES